MSARDGTYIAAGTIAERHRPGGTLCESMTVRHVRKTKYLLCRLASWPVGNSWRWADKLTCSGVLLFARFTGNGRWII